MKCNTCLDRLRDTLIHEMCHAAVWVQTGDRSAGHGPLWKKWANWATLLFPSLPNITRCHNYAINYKFYYICTQCHSQLVLVVHTLCQPTLFKHKGGFSFRRMIPTVFDESCSNARLELWSRQTAQNILEVISSG